MSGHLLELRLSLPLEQFPLEIDARSSEGVLGVFGPSGCGKTTILEALAGLRGGCRGRIRCDGETWLDSDRGIHLRPEQRQVGYVPQDHLLFPHLDVRRNLEWGARRARRGGYDCRQIGAEVIDVLELAPLLDRSASALSGGERQRVALGRAICSGPRLLLLDEPLASLDGGLRRRVLPFLVRVREHFDLPMLLVSHNPAEIQALCDEVLILQHGKVAARGAPTEVFARGDIYQSAAAEGFENMLPAVVCEHLEHSSSLHLGESAAGPVVTTLRVPHPPGSRLMVGIPANDIMVATKAPDGLSARNILPATIGSLGAIDTRQVITARLDSLPDHPVVAELTRESVEGLHLESGSRIHLVIKSSSIAVYG